ncbi:MAG: ribonuclease P protein component [Candidatus Omnitrophica bacterium]|nr:ribonuclease P protein component [Candidatus Omnitrophota bacterium]
MSSASLKKQDKLRRCAEFQSVYSKGLKTQGPHLILWALANKSHNCPRLGLSIAKRSFKLSTQRHALQRSLREAFRLNKPRFLPGYDVVVAARRFDQKKVGFQTLQKELLGLAQKAGVLKK